MEHDVPNLSQSGLVGLFLSLGEVTDWVTNHHCIGVESDYIMDVILKKERRYE